MRLLPGSPNEQVNRIFSIPPLPPTTRAPLRVLLPSTTMAFESRGKILEWDEHDVHLWLSKLGFPQYEAQIHGASLV